MSDSVFFDTSVLVYAYDTSDQVKQSSAQALIRDGIRSGTACVSAQVLGELFVVLTRKIPRPLAVAEAVDIVHRVARLEVVDIGILAVNLALHYVSGGGLSYWDALIVAAARLGGCSRLLSEDMAAGTTIDTVTVMNPFAEDPAADQRFLAISPSSRRRSMG